MNYLYDYHIHTTYSIDGHNKVVEICNAAIANGLKEIAITDHFELTPLDDSYNNFDLSGYLSDIAYANEVFKGKLKIKSGIELGQPQLFPRIAKNLSDFAQFDYIIGSIHKLPEGMDFSEIDYRNSELKDMCALYLNQVKNLIINGNFDCVGHLDLIKRYSTEHYKTKITLMTQYELLKQVLEIIISKGKGIEINTSGIRQAPRETMPGIDVLKLYHNLGGEILTIGSDSHYTEHVGKDLKVAIDNAESAGFKYLTIFNKRNPEWIKISNSCSFYFRHKKII